VLLLVTMAAAAPDDEVARAAATRAVLDAGRDAFTGVAPESDTRAVWQLGGCEGAEPWVTDLLAAACARDLSGRTLTGELRPTAALDLGNLTPDGTSGDTAPGWVGLRAGVRGATYFGPMVFRAAPSFALDLAPGITPRVVNPELWAGYDTGNAWFGVGQQDRWLGPGHHATLLLSDNAVAPWMVNGGVDGHLPGWARHLGRFRAELGLGVLTEPRGDVDLPGILMMDLRWLPVPMLEIGVNRLSLFGGAGRPPVDVGQLVLPTEPHVSDDPDKLLPDQDELATLNVKVNAPLHKWFGGPFGHLSAWWEYGGEDVIERKLGPLPYPALAGVANLYGGELAVGPVVATGEYARLMDDTFRWYVGHRVYHEGFTQDGRSMGHFAGGDSETASGELAVWGRGWRVRGWGDWTRRVGVVEAGNDVVYTLQAEEARVRAGAGVDLDVRGLWLRAGYTYGQTDNANFTAGNDLVEHRVVVALASGPAVALSAR
jgi:hypothetical protein